MPNNTTIMICFAACFALTLSAYTTDSSALAPSIRKLIVEAAGVLERLGTITKHRNGLSVLYGKYLRQIVRKAATANKTGGNENIPSVGATTTNLTSYPVTPTSSAPLPMPVAMAAQQQQHQHQHQHHHHQQGLLHPQHQLRSQQPSPHSPIPMQPQQQPGQPMLWPETLQFSAMSGDQITHVLNQPGNGFEPSFGGLSWQDMNNFDWLPYPEFGM